LRITNITSVSGAIKIDSGSRPQIRKNNIEQVFKGGSSSAMLDINGAAGTMYGGVIEGNHFGALTGAGITAIIRVNQTNGLSIYDNVLISGDKGVTAISIKSSVGTRIGPNTYNANITTKVLDGGTETVGAKGCYSCECLGSV
jgi:hypothetical protein